MSESNKPESVAGKLTPEQLARYHTRMSTREELETEEVEPLLAHIGAMEPELASWKDAAQRHFADMVRLEKENACLRTALKSMVDDIKQLDGTCPHETWLEAVKALEGGK